MADIGGTLAAGTAGTDPGATAAAEGSIPPPWSGI